MLFCSSSEVQFKYVYFNHTNLAQKTSIHGGSARRSANVPADILRLISDVNLDLNVYVPQWHCFILLLSLQLVRTAAVTVQTRGWALDRVHNSRRPHNCLTQTLTFDFWPNIHWWVRYRWTISVASLAILVSVVLVLSCGQTESQMWMNAILVWLPSAWVMNMY